MTLATFVEVLDTSIANVALPHIAGALSASQTEATWVISCYLIANAIVLPISGYLAAFFGRKHFMSCVAIFSISSLLCGLAPNLPTLLLFRVLQALGGGGVATSEQAILPDTSEPVDLARPLLSTVLLSLPRRQSVLWSAAGSRITSAGDGSFQ